MFIPFGEFAPDQSDQNTGISVIADNCIADASSYTPLKGIDSTQHTVTSISSTATLQGFYYYHISSNAPRDILKVDNKLFVNGNDMTQAGLSAPPSFIENGYPFVMWDEDLLIAGGGIVPQKISAAGLVSLGVTKTTDIGGSPPQCSSCAKIREFLVMGFTYDPVNLYHPDRVQWSGFNDFEEWTVGTNQSGFQDLIDGGNVERVIGGEYGIIFQTNAITRMTYVGSPLIWQFDEIENAKGTNHGNSVVQVGSNIYYFASDGFYILNDGVTASPIGGNKIDKWFIDLKHEDQDIKGAYDPVSDCVFWSFKTKSTAESDPNDRLLIFNIKSNKWSTGTVDTSTIYSADEFIDAGTNQVSPNALSCYTRVSTSATKHDFNGSTLAATIQTSEISDGENRTQLDSVRPVIDGTSTVIVSTRDLLTDTATDSASISLDSSGKANMRTNSRYHQIKVTTSGDFTHASGINVEVRQRGKR